MKIIFNNRGKGSSVQSFKSTSAVLMALTLSLVPVPAFAYIDPGSGGAIISAIIGAIVACGLYLKSYWYKLKRFVIEKRDGLKTKDDSD
jgi:hypothetical protein